MGEEKIVLDFRRIRGKRNKNIEDLLTLLIGESFNNPTLADIRKKLAEEVDKFCKDPEAREALSAYCHAENSIILELTACYDRFKKRIRVELKDFIY